MDTYMYIGVNRSEIIREYYPYLSEIHAIADSVTIVSLEIYV